MLESINDILLPSIFILEYDLELLFKIDKTVQVALVVLAVRLIVIVALVAVLVNAMVAVLEAVQVVLAV